MKDDIYIIDGTMIRNNKLVGHYDGRKVIEYGGNELYVKPKKEKREEVVISKSADINFSDYSKVVDEFFEKLEKEEQKRSVGYLG
jgi:uridine kinase